MSARSFRSVFMVASCAGAALGCYLVSLRVASERAALENVETEIVLAQRDIRLLQTEIGTRGRLAQLERWNVKVLALSAPSADQFLEGSFALAKLVAPERQVDLEAPVVLAAAPADGPRPQIEGVSAPPADDSAEGATPGEIMHTASLKRTMRPPIDKSAEPPKPMAPKPTASKPVEKPAAKPVTAAKAPAGKAVAAAKAPAGRPKPARIAQVDPLAPKPTSSNTPATAKDSGRKQ